MQERRMDVVSTLKDLGAGIVKPGPKSQSSAPRVTVRADSPSSTTGYSDEAVIARAQQAGQAERQSNAWGDNRQDLNMIGEIYDAARAHEETIAHELSRLLGPTEAAIEKAAAAISAAMKGLLGKAAEVARCDNERERLAARIKQEGLLLPPGPARIRVGALSLPWLSPLGLVLAVIGGGDLLTISLAYMPFGLSDAPILHTPVNELCIAAVSSVVAMLVLAEQLGHKLRLLSHHLQHRNDAPAATSDEGVAPPKRATALDVLIAAGCALGGGSVLWGLAAMRMSYAALMSPIAAGLSGAFLAVQVGIFLAATALSAHYAHPYGKEYRALVREQAHKRRGAAQARRRLATSVAAYNGLLRQRHNMIAMAHHHCGVTFFDAARQAALYADALTQNQPEPVPERLFPEGLPEPSHAPAHEELCVYLAGKPSSSYRHYQPADLQALLKAEAELGDPRSRQSGGAQ